MSCSNKHSGECLSVMPEIINKKANDEDSNKDLLVTYQEGAWGWVVVLTSAYCFGIIVGMINNYALIYDKLIKEYSTTEHNVFYSGINEYLIFP